LAVHPIFCDAKNRLSSEDFMTPGIPENAEARFSELADHYQPKLPRKLAILQPLRGRIEELRAKKASYDTIRILLAEVNIVVSNDTVYRFCRDVIGHKSSRPRHSNGNAAKSNGAQNGVSNRTETPRREQTPGGSIQEHLTKQRKGTSAPWVPRKRGPRIADSKNL
jgi:hypothetical protein